MRRVLDLIRGQHVVEARRILRFRRRRRRADVEKLLDSAVANAEQNARRDPRRTWWWRARGSTRARRCSGYRPRAYGRATRIRKRTSHITLVVDDDGRARPSGSEGQPLRVPAGGHLPLEVQLVRRPASTPTAARGLDPQAHPRRGSRAPASASIDIERKGDQIWVFIHTARPGIVIGRKGAEADRLRKDIERYTKKRVDVKVET